MLHSHATKSTCLLTDAEALLDRGSIPCSKTRTLVISRPSKPKPIEEVKPSAQCSISSKPKLIEEVKPSVQHPLTHEDKRGAPDEYATGHQQSVCESTTIDVSNIPRDMAEDTLWKIFESKHFGGGGEVTNIVYEKGRGSAVITLSDREGISFILSFIHSFVHSFIHSCLLGQQLNCSFIH